MRGLLSSIVEGVFWALVIVLALIAAFGPVLAWFAFWAAQADISAGPWLGFGRPMTFMFFGLFIWAGVFAGVMVWLKERFGIELLPGPLIFKPPPVQPPPPAPDWRKYR